ncbi:large conductance mechanosensitive channel protein MscL [Microbacterium sp. NC79]|uniref:large conductance mechanosensitive channel protein MscL n=1 Tax=Microbacterium sp. NC79 TaxID=2851009 RepID=UPI001C2BEED2|nr:large conductance mechanosensitive channel protein MscL [Microbacterium sp. NC79]MBV0895424.1 large conductance mechanosensitive channel protein MscL [Microbacterium sp. NC79]
MLKGFRDFILRGNVIDLAVAVVIGAAFTAVVTAIVDGFITPLIAATTPTGQIETAVFSIGNWDIAWGLILAAIIKFISVAAVVYFVMIVPMNKFKELQAKRAGITEEEEALSETDLLVQIRDLLAEQKKA